MFLIILKSNPMKFLALMVLFSSAIQAQTLNERVMKKINEYRTSFGISPLVYEPKAKKANEQMLNYKIETSTMPMDHSQRIPTSYPQTFETFADRIYYLYEYNYNYIGENLCTFGDLSTDEERANMIMTLWKNSIPHNELLLSLRYTGFYVDTRVSNTLIINGKTLGGPTRYVVLTTYN